MKTFAVKYQGNSSISALKNFNVAVDAESKKDAVISVYKDWFDYGFFPDDNGNILDMDGEIIMYAGDDRIKKDGGWFYAEEITNEIKSLLE